LPALKQKLNKIPAINIQLFQQAVEHERTGIVITDATRIDNPIIYANPFFEEFTGYHSDEILGRNCRFLQGRDTCKSAIRRMRGTLIQNKGFEETILNYKRDGTPFWNRLTVAAIKDADGEIHNYVGIQEDITARINAEAERDAIIGALHEIKEGLANFAHTVAHDLKAPLRGIDSFAQLIQDTQGTRLDKQGTEYLHFVRSSAQRMNNIIQSILSYSTMGHKAEDLESIDSQKLTEEIITSLGPHGVRYIKIISRLPTVVCRRSLTVQIFQNLLSNALKYGMPAQNGNIEISYLRESTNWRFFISDRGPGIDHQDFEKIFLPFQTLQIKGADSTGIGLAIVKKSVELCGGELDVQSCVGEGSTFSFTLPFLSV